MVRGEGGGRYGELSKIRSSFCRKVGRFEYDEV